MRLHRTVDVTFAAPFANTSAIAKRPCLLPTPAGGLKSTACGDERGPGWPRDDGTCRMIPVLVALFTAVRVFFRTRTEIAVELIAVRRQLAVLKRKRPRPPLRPLDRLFWTALRATCPADAPRW